MMQLLHEPCWASVNGSRHGGDQIQWVNRSTDADILDEEEHGDSGEENGASSEPKREVDQSRVQGGGEMRGGEFDILQMNIWDV